MKRVMVCMLENGRNVERDIGPGTTAGDVLRDVGLPNGLLSGSQNGDIFANADGIYEKVAEGQKLFASTPASVGSSFLENVISKTIERLGGRYVPRPSETLVMSGGASRRPAPLVQRREIPYWQERGWKRIGWTYKGNYVTPYGAYKGRICQSGISDIQFFIQHPPNWIFNTSHAPCFQPRGEAWFLVHMSYRPKDISSGIITIERLLKDSFRAGGRHVNY